MGDLPSRDSGISADEVPIAAPANPSSARCRAAGAPGKPCIWTSRSTQDRWCFKFRDWFLTADNPQDRRFPLECGLEELIEACGQRLSAIGCVKSVDGLSRDNICHDDGDPLSDLGAVRAVMQPVVRLDPPVSRDWSLQDRTHADAERQASQRRQADWDMLGGDAFFAWRRKATWKAILARNEA